MCVPATIAWSFSNASRRGRYFIPQEVGRNREPLRRDDLERAADAGGNALRRLRLGGAEVEDAEDDRLVLHGAEHLRVDDDIQLEALDTLLRFYLIDVPVGTKRVAVVFETGRKDPAEAAFAIGPYQILPRPGARRREDQPGQGDA